MPRIFDNIDKSLLPALQETLGISEHADFCVGYFNLRGWDHLMGYVDRWAGGEGHCCRLLIGMHIKPSDEFREIMRASAGEDTIPDNQTVARERRKIAEEFQRQLTFGAPTNSHERTLQRLARQIRDKKVVVKVFLRDTLHAKLYLMYRSDPVNPIVGYLGSSNLTLAGLSKQGELNVDVLDYDTTTKLAKWFEGRWEDRLCLDISEELAKIIDESWAGEDLISPYHVYLKMAYHLAQEARVGLKEFQIPPEFGDTLFDFQIAAVKIAARHLHKRRGVLLGDVVGLGKSLIATALAKIFDEDLQMDTLIICPKNLVRMWEDYVHEYRLHAEVMSLSMVQKELPDARRYRIVLIDESHNLRNKSSQRWRAIRDYIVRNESFCILLSATPYNKAYEDISGQLGLFLKKDHDLTIRPEELLSDLGGEREFAKRHEGSVRSITAFEKSEFPDDWRDLMRLFMVRRTRGFIEKHYAKTDRYGKYLVFPDGRKSYFPKRIPKTLPFVVNEEDPDDSYARFYSDRVVSAINSLNLSRYGLGNYLLPEEELSPTQEQRKNIDNLSRAGAHLKGFCRINLFKRLESAGPAFVLSVKHHILRNFVFLYALENGLNIPLGSQDAEMLDTGSSDYDDERDDEGLDDTSLGLMAEGDYRARAREIYENYAGPLHERFEWLPSGYFCESLVEDLRADARSLIEVLDYCGEWQPEQDAKLRKLVELVRKDHGNEKILVFTQFSDTAHYLKQQLCLLGIQGVEMATGDSANPLELAWRFSPVSNGKVDRYSDKERIRVLITTDVLSEGQNLQDCAIVANYDLPWAIIRLIQRAGRVDRIGQESKEILCYSFLPADGVERLIRLRARVKERLEANNEVVGSDEKFFGDEAEKVIPDLYNEKSGILDDEDDEEVDLASYAYQIWKDAIDKDSSLERKIACLPDVIYATKALNKNSTDPKGALIYTRTTQNNDVLAWVDENGNPVTQSQLRILKAAACSPETKAFSRTERHHELVQQGLERITEKEGSFGGTLGRRSSARSKTYERLKRYHSEIGGHRDLFITDERVEKIALAYQEILNYPLCRSAIDTLNRQIRTGIDDHKLAELVLGLREGGDLCVIGEERPSAGPQLICSMGLVTNGN